MGKGQRDGACLLVFSNLDLPRLRDRGGSVLLFVVGRRWCDLRRSFRRYAGLGGGDYPQYAGTDGGGEDLHDLEHSHFGWSHDQIAARMCDEWELPAALREAIGGHHGSASHEAPPGVVLSAPFREVPDGDVRDMVVTMADETYNVKPDVTVALLAQAEEDASSIAQMFT